MLQDYVGFAPGRGSVFSNERTVCLSVCPFHHNTPLPYGGGGSKNPVQTFWNFNVPVTCSCGLLCFDAVGLAAGRASGL